MDKQTWFWACPARMPSQHRQKSIPSWLMSRESVARAHAVQWGGGNVTTAQVSSWNLEMKGCLIRQALGREPDPEIEWEVARLLRNGAWGVILQNLVYVPGMQPCDVLARQQPPTFPLSESWREAWRQDTPLLAPANAPPPLAAAMDDQDITDPHLRWERILEQSGA